MRTFKRRVLQRPSGPFALAWVVLSTILLPACSSPLDFDHYSGHISAVFSTAGRTYKTAWNVKIYRRGLFSIDAGHGDKWSMTPGTALVDLDDGHAVWLDTFQGAVVEGYTVWSGTIANLLALSTEQTPSSFQALDVWFDSTRHPKLLKLPGEPCTTDFPIEECSVRMILRMPGKHRNLNSPLEFMASNGYPFVDELRNRIAPDARDDLFINSRYFTCPALGWRNLPAMARKIADTGPMRAVVLTPREAGQLFLLCVPRRGPRWVYRPVAGQLTLFYDGDGKWSVGSGSATTATYYNVGLAPLAPEQLPHSKTLIGGPLYDYAPYFKTVRLPSGSVDISSTPPGTRVAIEDKATGMLYVLGCTQARSLDELYYEWVGHHLDSARDAH
jgi:hypothetical protein